MHSQNLNDLPGDRHGSILRHGRCWIGPFEICWRLFQEPGFHIGLGIGEGDDTALSVGVELIVFSLWISWDNFKIHSWLSDKTKREDQKYGNGREIKVYWNELALWWTLWGDPMKSRSKDPWYVRMHCWDLRDILFGRSKYSSRTIREERVIIPMPEGGYPALVKINDDTWKRPRWPFPRKMIRASVIPDKPIPFPGKGESSWNCGEDAMYSLYGPYDNSLKAAIAATESVMRDRLKYGAGWNYRPEMKGGDDHDEEREGRAEN